MTTADEPVLGIDLVDAACAYLRLQPGVYNVLGSDNDWDVWLFQDTLMTRVESSQKTACVVRQDGGWTQPNMHNTARFPRLVVEFYGDPDRDAGNNTSEPLSAKDKILAAFNVIDRFLHFTTMRDQWWPEYGTNGAMRVLNSSRASELQFFPVPDGDGLMRGSVTYNVGVG